MDPLKRLFTKLWHDPVWSKVIASLIVAIPSAYFLGLFPILADVFRGTTNFLSESTSVFNGVLICLIIISFVAVIIAAKIIHQKAAEARRVLRFVPLHSQRSGI
jgi:predicted CDP-diglyceride synthetase/phosphatidate cytidylyltransferase